METELYAVNKGMKYIKYTLLGTNILFAFAALLLLSLGIAVQTIHTDFGYFLHRNFLSVSNLVIAIGLILFLISLFGIIAAVKQSTLLTNIFATILLIAIILEISAAITASILPQESFTIITDTIWDAFNNYEKKVGARNAMDYLQKSTNCCGVYSMNDWLEKHISIPDSCCSEWTEYAGLCKRYWYDGCINRLELLIKESATAIVTGVSTIAFVQFFVVIFAFVLANAIRRTKTLRAVALNGRPN